MNIKGLNVLVTGSEGMIGKSLCNDLKLAGAYVYGVDKQKRAWGFREYTRFIAGDLLVVGMLQEHCSLLKIDLIIHLAANARINLSTQRPNLAMENLIMLFNVLEFARLGGIKRVMFASSREVYGESEATICDEVTPCVKNCASNYAATKIAGEGMVRAYFNCYGIEYVIFRFSGVYGKYDYTDRVIPIFMCRALSDKPLVVFGKGKVLDFTYIDDCLSGVIKAIRCFDKVKGEVFNIASQTGWLIEEVAEMIVELTSSKSNIKFGGSRRGEVSRFIGDISKARVMLGYEPEWELREGLVSSIEWFLQYREEYIRFLREYYESLGISSGV